MNAISVPFHGATLFVVECDSQPYAPMKPIAEGMGVSWQGQHEKLKANPERWGIKEILIPSAGGEQAMSCMPLRKLPGWLMTIHPNKVKPEVRERIIRYQNECDDALWDYWTKGQATRPTVDPDQLPIAPHQQHELQVIVARKSGQNGATRAMLWSRFNNHFKLGSYKQLPAGMFSEAVAYLEGIQTAHDPARVPGRDKVYSYPRSMLEQRHFKAMGGLAPAALSIDMLAHAVYESPTVAMLREMSQDGHQVEAPMAEQVALHEGLQAADQAMRNIMTLAWGVLGQPSSRAGQF